METSAGVLGWKVFVINVQEFKGILKLYKKVTDLERML